MLILSRKPGEEIHIGTDTLIAIRSFQGNRVLVAIEAPAATRILWGERWTGGHAASPGNLSGAESATIKLTGVSGD